MPKVFECGGGVGYAVQALTVFWNVGMSRHYEVANDRTRLDINRQGQTSGWNESGYTVLEQCYPIS